jgi:hypothetical protein
LNIKNAEVVLFLTKYCTSPPVPPVVAAMLSGWTSVFLDSPFNTLC